MPTLCRVSPIDVEAHAGLDRPLAARLDEPTADAEVEALHYQRIVVFVRTTSLTGEDAALARRDAPASSERLPC